MRNALLVLWLAACGNAQSSSPLPRPSERDSDEIPQADNSGRNRRDADGANPTPLDQGNDPADIATTADLRRQLVGDPGLSIDAQNIKIITQHGVMVLRGVVHNAGEKQTINERARATPGVTHLDDQLEIDVK
jgi:osmotically-inducible protein OsmY